MTTELAPFPLPAAGLAEVLTAWTGDGAADEFFRTLALIGADGDSGESLAERAWAEEQVARERANRVLVGRLAPWIERLPTRSRAWLDALPAETRSTRDVSDRPAGSVDWPRTSRSGSWPPREFHIRRRQRADDSVLVRVVRWTVDQLLPAGRDAKKLAPTLVSHLDPQFQALRLLADHPMLAQVSTQHPTVQEVRAVRAMGRPWASLGPIASYLLQLGDVTTLANELIIPEPSLAWRLFHLACFGEVLVALKEEGCDLTAAAPLYAGSGNPAYVALVPDGSRIDLWFEGSGCWRTYAPAGTADPYRRAAESASSRAGTLSPDILLVRHSATGEQSALVFECKSGADVASAARDGYLQAVAYGVQLHSMTAMPVASWVVGRDDLFGLPSAAPLLAGALDSIGMTSASNIGAVATLWNTVSTTQGAP